MKTVEKLGGIKMLYFSEKLRYARANAGLSQKELADVCGISVRTISSYETGRCNPSSRVIVKMANALKVSKEYLLNDNCQDPTRETEQKIVEVKKTPTINEIIGQTAVLLAGGEISTEEKEQFAEIMSSLIEKYK